MKNLNLRLPDELHALLQMAALDDRRSLNSEIITLLSGALARRRQDESRPALSDRLPPGKAPGG